MFHSCSGNIRKHVCPYCVLTRPGHHVYCDDSLLGKKDWNCMKSILFDVTSETSAIGYVRKATGLSGNTAAMF